MKERDIAKKIAFVYCTHVADRPCSPCLNRFDREVSKLGRVVLQAAARYFDSESSFEKITPLTWYAALSVAKCVLKAAGATRLKPQTEKEA